MSAIVLEPPPRERRAAWLESGMNLDVEEFLRRYEALPEVNKAELIEGVVFMGSPVRIDEHAEPDSVIQGWLLTYVAATPGLQVAGNATIRLGPRNAPQPDALLRIRPESGGQSANSDDGCVLGAPELVAEISASTRSLDLHGKKAAYERLGVREYLVWSVDDAEVLWFHRRGEAFARLAPEADGVVQSLVFPGLWLDVPALLRSDPAGVLARLQAGLATTEHRTFRETLAGRHSPAAARARLDVSRPLTKLPTVNTATLPAPKVWTEAEVQALPDDGCNHEIVDGELVMSPKNNWQHGDVCMRLSSALHAHALAHRLGAVFDSSTGFWMANRNCRAPDISFVTRGRLRGLRRHEPAFIQGAPDLAVEILSPGLTRRDLDARLHDFFASGTRLAWVIDPDREFVEVCHSPTQRLLVPSNGTLDGETVLPGFTFLVADLFKEWDW